VETLIGRTNGQYEVIAQKPRSSAEGEINITVLAEGMNKDAYVVWNYNTQSGGFGCGDYFHGDTPKEDALQRFNER
jgi:hypothetical protein